MRKITRAVFCLRSNLPRSLINAVVKQSGGWGSFKESASDIHRCGIDSGFHGFIYTQDTVAFAAAHKEEIIAVAREMASELGEPGAYSLIAGFNCFKDYNLTGDDVADILYDPKHEDYDSVMNALAWFAGEEVARAYDDAVQS